MSTSHATQGYAPQHVTEHPHAGSAGWLTWSARAGIIGPVLFTATYMAQEFFRQDEYSPIAEPVSALEAGPNAWVQQANFVVFGLLTLVFAVGVHRGVRPSRGGVVGPALLFVSGIGLFLAAIFPLREDAAGVTYDPGFHFVAGVLFFGTSAAALITLSLRLARDPRWQGIAMYVRVCGLLALVGFFVLGVLAIPDDAPLHDWAGLAQRAVLLGVLFPARIVIALRLSKVAASGSSPSR